MTAVAPPRGTTVIRPRIAYFWWLEASRSTQARTNATSASGEPQRSAYVSKAS
jgi:hypothetical protein